MWDEQPQTKQVSNVSPWTALQLLLKAILNYLEKYLAKALSLQAAFGIPDYFWPCVAAALLWG